MSKLNEAIIMATLAHGETLDKCGEPYILHPLAVMLDPSLTTERERICAVLHDVLEDTYVTGEEIKEQFGLLILEDVQSVSRGYIHKDGHMEFKEPCFNRVGLFVEDFTKETYTAFITRAGQNEVTRKVKIADLRHNLKPERLAKVASLAGIEKRYNKALIQLGAV